MVDLTHKKDVNEYSSNSTLQIINLLLNNAQSIFYREGNNQHYYVEHSLCLSNIEKTIAHDDFLTKTCQNFDEGCPPVFLSLNIYYVAAITDNNLLYNGITQYNIHSVPHMYTNMNNKNKTALLIGNTYLPNIQYCILKDYIYNQPRLKEKYCQILLIGLVYPEEIKRQWDCIYTPNR